MKKIENTTKIKASADKVWQVLMDESYYMQWYAAFGVGSKATSDWKEGSKIIFSDDNGMGLIGTIAVLNPAKEFRVKMKGILNDGVEDYDSDHTKGLELAEERYVLTEAHGTTTLYTTADMDESWYDSMSVSWENALKKIKELAEQH
ncbi:MAG: SRPBCC domain-containing protein [Bacteroidota bacterium]